MLASDHFCLHQDLQVLSRNGFSKNDCHLLQDSLMEQTRNIINQQQGLWLGDCQKVQKLPNLHQQIMRSQVDEKTKLRSLLAICREYGTGPFAGLARTAFMAVCFLQSLVNRGVLSTLDQALFMRSLSTVSGSLLHAMGTTSRDQFLRKYGHLRPGMYDITSPRYDQMPDEYFCWSFETQETKTTLFRLNKKQQVQIDVLLEQHHYEFTATEFMSFIKRAIEWREKAKFIFNRTVSEILLLCQQLGHQYQLDNQDLSFLKIDQIIQLSSTKTALEFVVEAQKQYTLTQALVLPPLITMTDDFDSFQMPPQQPNFITLERITAQVVHLAAIPSVSRGNLRGKIIMLPSADPGHDWLFTHHIAGLMTRYGGCNSHMAIRAAELSLPAVIGMGEVLFQQFSNAQLLMLDCEQQTIHRLQ